MDNNDTEPEEDCDNIKNLRERINCEEKNLNRLTKKYASLRTTVDKNYPADIIGKYRTKASACIAVFVAVFAISYLLSPYFPFLHISNYGNAAEFTRSLTIHANNALSFSDKIIFSIITGISAAVVMIILFVVDSNLKSQRLNEMLASKSFEISEKRSSILSLLQRDSFADESSQRPGSPLSGPGGEGFTTFNSWTARGVANEDRKSNVGAPF